MDNLSLKHILLAIAATASLTSTAADAAEPKGLELYKQGKYVQAASLLRQEVTANPRSSSAYYYLACCYYQLGQTADARTMYETISRQFPTTTEAGLSLKMLAQLSPHTGAMIPGGTPNVAGMNHPQTEVRPVALHFVPSVTKKSASEADLSSLPDETKFYFKRAPNGHMETDAMINGRPLKVWFDTGAGAHFGFNHLQPLGILKPNRAPDSYTYGWAGVKVPIWLIQLPVKLGGMTRTIQCSVEEDMSLTPLIGQDFIQGFTYEIDDRGGCMYLKKQGSGNSSANVDPLYDVPCTKKGRDDYIPLEMNGRKADAFIDTGAASTIIHPSTLRSLGIEIPEDAPVRMIGGVGGSTAVRQMELDLRVGPIRRQGFSVLVGGSAGNCIGQDFMEGWRFTVDRQRNLMRFFH